MSSEAVARRYARAVFELARDEGRVREVADELGRFAAAYEASADFRELEHSPALGDAERESIVTELGQRLGASPTTIRTVAMLATRQRLSVLPDLVKLVDAMADEHLGILRGEVRSAKPLPDSYRERLKKKIEEATGKKVVLRFEEDPSLIAGIVTRIGDQVIDGSVRGRLSRLAESLRQP